MTENCGPVTLTYIDVKLPPGQTPAPGTTPAAGPNPWANQNRVPGLNRIVAVGERRSQIGAGARTHAPKDGVYKARLSEPKR